MRRYGRPPLTPKYLEEQGTPTVTCPAEGIVAIISGDGYETVDMTKGQALEVAARLQEWESWIPENEDE